MIFSIQTLNEAKRPLVILGSAMFERQDAKSIFASAAQLAEQLRTTASKEYKDWRVFNVLQRVKQTSFDFLFVFDKNFIYYRMHHKSLLLILATNQM